MYSEDSNSRPVDPTEYVYLPLFLPVWLYNSDDIRDERACYQIPTISFKKTMKFDVLVVDMVKNIYTKRFNFNKKKQN
jgi:hypothetical protein